MLAIYPPIISRSPPSAQPIFEARRQDQAALEIGYQRAWPEPNQPVRLIDEGTFSPGRLKYDVTPMAPRAFDSLRMANLRG